MTGDHARYVDDAAAYALGALNELETTAFERHLMRCETCASDVERYRSVVDTLPSSVPQHEAPAAIKRSVMDTVRAEATEPEPEPRRVASRRSSRIPILRRPRLALAGGLAAAALLAGGYGLGTSTSDGERDVIAATVDRAQLPAASAELDASDDIGVLRVRGLPRLDRGRAYVVWTDRGNGPVYESSFNVRPGGDGEAGVGDLDGVARVMVTREASTAVTRPGESPVVTVQLRQ